MSRNVDPIISHPEQHFARVRFEFTSNGGSPGVGKSLKPEVYPVTAGLEKGFEEFGLATCGRFVID